MGMYDEITVTCPHCGQSTTFQTKVGLCSLKHYSISELPKEMIEGLHGRKEYCEKCDRSFYIEKRERIVYQAVVVDVCPECHGKGEIWDDLDGPNRGGWAPCPFCLGKKQ